MQTTFIWWLGCIMLMLGGTAMAVNQVRETKVTKLEHALALVLTLCGVAALIGSGNPH